MLAGSYAGSANAGSSRGSQTPITGGGGTYVPSTPTYVVPSPDFVTPAPDADADEAPTDDADVSDMSDTDASDAATWAPSDPGPQYSDNSIASGLREQAARVDDTADDIEAARGDVAQAQVDGDADATMMQASGAAKIVESGADGAMALAGEVGGPGSSRSSSCTARPRARRARTRTRRTARTRRRRSRRARRSARRSAATRR